MREWLLELKMMGRSPRTIEWYRQKMAWYMNTGQAEALLELTAYELKRYLGELRDRGLADNTVSVASDHFDRMVMGALVMGRHGEGRTGDRGRLPLYERATIGPGWPLPRRTV